MEKGIVLRLQLFIFTLSASNACFSPFLPVYFSSRNLTYSEIGAAFAISAIIGVLFQPLWGYISDKHLNKRRTLFVTMLINMVIILFFMKAVHFQLIISLIIINNIFMCGIGPIMDAYTFDVIEEREGLNYSKFRVMASAGYAVTNLILGYIIKAFGINISFVIYEVLALGGFLLLLTMKYEGKRSLRKIEIKDIGVILSGYKQKAFFITVFLMNAALIGGVNYMNELINFTKGDVSKLGLVWFVTCVFEVITFFVAVKLMKKYGIVQIYMMSLFIYGSKFILDYLVSNANFIIAIQVFEGIAFTLFITSSLEYLNENTDAEVRATAMSIYAAFGGFGAFSSSLLGGAMLYRINPSELYGIFGILSFLSLLCSMFLKVKDTGSKAAYAE